MEIGLALPQFDFGVDGEVGLRWGTVAEWATRAERLGFGSVWLADHLFWDLSRYGGPPEPAVPFAPLPALAALARHTTDVRLGTLVLCTPLRPPAVLAKALATLDVVAGGRLVAGVGAGWYEPEFEVAGVPFLPPGQRLAQLSEGIDVLRGMFGGGPFSFSGRHASVHEAMCLPVPVQAPSPRIFVGGRGDALLRLAARQADGWNTVWVMTPDRYEQRLGVLAEACERVGRNPATVTRSLGLYALVGEDEADLRRRFGRLRELAPPGVLDGTSLDDWRQGRLVGTVEHVREQVEAWAAVGVDELIAAPGSAPFVGGSLDDLEMVAEACSLGGPCQPQAP